jgi:hypothetical protein
MYCSTENLIKGYIINILMNMNTLERYFTINFESFNLRIILFVLCTNTVQQHSRGVLEILWRKQTFGQLGAWPNNSEMYVATTVFVPIIITVAEDYSSKMIIAVPNTHTSCKHVHTVSNFNVPNAILILVSLYIMVHNETFIGSGLPVIFFDV